MKNDLVIDREASEEDLSLRDLWNTLLAYKRVVLGLPLLAAALAVAFVLSVKPQWEAVGVIQVGQIWQGQEGLAIEAPARAVERVKLMPFQAAVLTELGISTGEENPLRGLYTSSLKVRVLPNTDLIEIKVRAYSRQEAQRWVEATVHHLRQVHSQLAEPSIGRLRLQLAGLTRQMELLLEERERLFKSAELKTEIGPGNRFAENLLLSNFLLQKNAELRDFELRKLELEEQLNTAKTYPTSLIDKVHVPEKRAYPKRTLTVILAAMVGLFVSVILAFLSNSLRANRLTNN